MPTANKVKGGGGADPLNPNRLPMNVCISSNAAVNAGFPVLTGTKAFVCFAYCRRRSAASTLRAKRSVQSRCRFRAAADESVVRNGIALRQRLKPLRGQATAGIAEYFVHPSAVVDEGAVVGKGTKIWHFCHIMKGAKIGERCTFGQNVNVDGGTTIGNMSKFRIMCRSIQGWRSRTTFFWGPPAC